MTEEQTADRPEFPELTEDEFVDLTAAEPEARSVQYAGQDFDVEGLVRRVRNRDIVVPQFGHNDPDIESAGFQRGFVWRKSQMDRFIESLLLGYPIPGVFFVRQSDRRYLVLDGQQRLLTLRDFYEGTHGSRVFSLANVSKRFEGLTYKSLPDDLRRTLDNAFIQATIVDTDGTPQSLEAVYQIFERLNSGGTQLTPHEIRVALYAGPLIELLERLNQDTNWRALYGGKSSRARDQELILRIIALYCGADRYASPLKKFLNDFAGMHRDATSEQVIAASKLFARANATILAGPGPQALRKGARQVNAAQAEAIYVGLMRHLAQSEITPEAAAAAIDGLKGSDDFEASTSRATANEEPMATRLRLATEAFADAA
ncbi:DUF262 domain-containing protein [Paraoerskovia marina]|uniref:DUF262 domain-containing protein n=1 Tax=Paraoerskovia marina TaxID=545619 RepID=UPI0006948F8C|nr:DUF262 domain-containing protein [Paraoerskovia marina]